MISPPGDSITNNMNMGQALQRKQMHNEAISAFLRVIDEAKSELALNPGSSIDMKIPAIALGLISDSYTEIKDFKKAILFRNCQNTLLEFLLKEQSAECADEYEFDNVARKTKFYEKLFEQYQEAVDAPLKPPPEDPRDFIRRYQEAKKQEEEETIERAIKMLEDYNKQMEEEEKNSFVKRNIRRIGNHPIISSLLILFTAIVIVLIARRPRKARNESFKLLEDYIKEFENAKHS